jgi:hypothetical protein
VLQARVDGLGRPGGPPHAWRQHGASTPLQRAVLAERATALRGVNAPPVVLASTRNCVAVVPPATRATTQQAKRAHAPCAARAARGAMSELTQSGNIFHHTMTVTQNFSQKIFSHLDSAPLSVSFKVPSTSLKSEFRVSIGTAHRFACK